MGKISIFIEMLYVRYLFFLIFLPFSSTGQNITTIVGNGNGVYAGDNGPASLAQITSNTIATDRGGNLYIAGSAHSRIRKVSLSGIITTIAGTGEAGYSGDGGAATLAKIGEPVGIYADSVGNIYFTDWGNATIRKIGIDGTIKTIAGTGIAGYSGDGGPATLAKLSAPTGIVMDVLGNIYFTEVTRVRKIGVDGIISTVAGVGTLGYSGDGGQATAARISYPGYIANMLPSTLYWTEWSNNIVRKLDLSTGIISTVAGNGITGYSGDGGLATDASMMHPNAIVLDTVGNIYVADYDANVIRRINISTNIITTVAGTGIYGFSGDGTPATDAHFKKPNSIVFDKWGNLYINDYQNFRIRRVNYNAITALNEISSDKITAIIYPNPSTDKVTITANKPIYHITVINILNQVVVNRTTNKKELSLDVAHLPVGIYLIKADGVYVGQFLKE